MDNQINIKAIENGYIVSQYITHGEPGAIGRYVEYYCIDLSEINRRVEELLFNG